MTTISKTVRLPAEVVEAAEHWGDALGLSFTDVVEMALRDKLPDLGDSPAFTLLTAVRDWLETFDKQDFPQDVTLRVFQHIQDDPQLWQLYLRATDDRSDSAKVGSVHRRIGKAVKLVLGAKVVGRSLPLDPDEHVIQSHALLVPGD